MIFSVTRHNTKINISDTGLQISRLGLGTAPLAGLFTPVSDSESDELVLATLESGINYFDTAPQYGHGTSEIRLGRILKESKKPFVVQTKVGRVLNPTASADRELFANANPHLEPIFDYSSEGIKRSIEESLQRLGLDHIDIALLHDPDEYLDRAISDAYSVLDDYRRQGIIKGVGVGTNACAPAIHIMKECDLDIILIAGRYSLLDQEAERELLPMALAKSVAILVAGVYNSGVLANPNPGSTYDYLPASQEIIDRARAIGQFLKERGVSLTAAALQFPLRHPAVTAVLTGSRNTTELHANIHDFNTDLPENLWQELESTGLIQTMRRGDLL